MKMYMAAAVGFCIGYIIVFLLDEIKDEGCKRQPIRVHKTELQITIRAMMVGAAWPVYLLYILISYIALNGEEVGRCLISRKKKKKSITRKQRGFWKKTN